MADSIERVVRFEINLDAGLSAGKNDVLLMQGDEAADVLELVLLRGGTALPLDGIRGAIAMVVNADGQKIRNVGEIGTDAIRIRLAAESYAVAGPCEILVTLTASDVTRTVLKLVGYVNNASEGIIIDPSGSIPTLEQVAILFAELTNELAVVRETTTNANTQADSAKKQAAEAKKQAANAATATTRADNAAKSIEGLTVSETSVAYGAGVDATVTKNDDGTYHIALQAEQGAPFLVLGRAYPTVEALAAAVPNPEEGDNYNVGTSTPFNIYRWTGTEWEDQGKLQGPPGLTISVNGVEQVDGNVTLTGNDVPLSGTDSTSLTAAIGEKASVMRRSATLAVAGWSSAAPYTQVVSVSGMTATMAPHCDVVLSADNDVAASEKEAWGCVDKVESGANRLTVTCLADKPEVALNMQIEVVY